MSGVSVGSVDDGSLLQVELKEGVCLVCLSVVLTMALSCRLS